MSKIFIQSVKSQHQNCKKMARDDILTSFAIFVAQKLEKSPKESKSYAPCGSSMGDV